MTKYINKSKLASELEKAIDDPAPSHDQQCPWEDGYYCGLYKAESIIDTLEVKETNLNKESVCKSANGEDLPEINREVIVLLNNNKVCYAHRPPEFWDGKNIATDEITRHYPKRYDKGNWNISDVKWWLDLDLPKMEE